MGVGAALTVLVLFIATVNAGPGVEFRRKNFKMTCPEVGKWYKGNDKTSIEENPTHEVEYNNKNKGAYRCEYGKDDIKTKYYFYVQGKACDNCFELDAALIGLAILLDVIGTAAVMFIIYKCSKNKRSDGPSAASKGTARSGGRGPAVPSPDYEQLNPNNRQQEEYSMLNRTR